MKISEIIASLQATLDEHGDMVALLSSDEEGNSYRVADVGGVEQMYDDGDGPHPVHPQDLLDGEYGAEDDIAAMGLVNCVVFW